MAPGFDLFSHFGHNALLVRERATGAATVYNFGSFDAGDPNLLSKYLARKLDYFLTTSDLTRTLANYRGRTMWAQKLDLPAAASDRMVAHLRWMAQPENAAYRYDHIRDNCSTRIRDLIDDVTGNALRARFAQEAGRTTIRRELESILGPHPFERFGVSYILGGVVDAAATRWDLHFLPKNLRDDIAEVEILHPDGTTRPLVSAAQTLLDGTLEPTSMSRWPFFLIGLAFVVPFALLVVWGRSRLLRLVAGLWLALWGVLAGVGGGLLVFLWVVGFPAGEANGNLLLTSPLHIVFGPLGVLWAFGKLGPRGTRWLRSLLWIVLAVAVGDLAAHVLGFATQSHAGLAIASALIPGLALGALREMAQAPLAAAASLPTPVALSPAAVAVASPPAAPAPQAAPSPAASTTSTTSADMDIPVEPLAAPPSSADVAPAVVAAAATVAAAVGVAAVAASASSEPARAPSSEPARARSSEPASAPSSEPTPSLVMPVAVVEPTAEASPANAAPPPAEAAAGLVEDIESPFAGEANDEGATRVGETPLAPPPLPAEEELYEATADVAADADAIAVDDADAEDVTAEATGAARTEPHPPPLPAEALADEPENLPAPLEVAKPPPMPTS
jgi:hypothetical protein